MCSPEQGYYLSNAETAKEEMERVECVMCMGRGRYEKFNKYGDSLYDEECKYCEGKGYELFPIKRDQ